jgi:hypothetical protein
VEWAHKWDPNKHGFHQADDPKSNIYMPSERPISSFKTKINDSGKRRLPHKQSSWISLGRFRRTARTMRRNYLPRTSMTTSMTASFTALPQCNISLIKFVNMEFQRMSLSNL